MRHVLAALVWALTTTSAFAESAVVLRNTYLRLDSSTDQAPIRKLLPGETLTLLAPEPDDGYYQVSTQDLEEGWVWGKNIRIETGGAAPFKPTALAAATSFNPDWAKPPPKGSSFKGMDGTTCGFAGIGAEKETNQRKNRTDEPTTVHDVSFRALADLPYPEKSSNKRTKWTEDQLAIIRPFEGVGVRVIGFLVAIKLQTGSKEDTNCDMSKAAETDWHMALVEKAGQGEEKAVVIETTPRVRRKHPKWTKGPRKNNLTEPGR